MDVFKALVMLNIDDFCAIRSVFSDVWNPKCYGIISHRGENDFEIVGEYREQVVGCVYFRQWVARESEFAVRLCNAFNEPILLVHSDVILDIKNGINEVDPRYVSEINTQNVNRCNFNSSDIFSGMINSDNWNGLSPPSGILVPKSANWALWVSSIIEISTFGFLKREYGDIFISEFSNMMEFLSSDDIKNEFTNEDICDCAYKRHRELNVFG